MLHTELSWFWRRRFVSVVLPYIGMVAFLFNVAEPFEQIDNTRSTEGVLLNLVKIEPAVSGERTFKYYAIL